VSGVPTYTIPGVDDDAPLDPTGGEKSESRVEHLLIKLLDKLDEVIVQQDRMEKLLGADRSKVDDASAG